MKGRKTAAGQSRNATDKIDVVATLKNIRVAEMWLFSVSSKSKEKRKIQLT